jgi:type IV pilus assembly protein PilC
METLRNIRNRLPIKDQALFAKRLAFLIQAGIPMRESLVMIRSQTRKKFYASILDTIIYHVSNGQSLSVSLGRFKRTFGDFTINIIGFGEESGTLPENLEYIARELTKRQALRKKIIAAAVYPIIVGTAMVGIVVFLMVYLFPKIIPIFKSVNLDLPVSTRIIITVSDAVSRYGLIGLTLVVIISIIFLIVLKKSSSVRFYYNKALLKIPVIGKVIKDYNLANFTRTFGLLMKSGVNIIEALPILRKTTANPLYAGEFRTLSDTVARGEKISGCLEKTRELFPDTVTYLIAAGEQSGSLAASLLYLSEMYEGELDDFTRNLASAVEPVLMILVGAIVGFIAVSIITPIYGITQNLTPK